MPTPLTDADKVLRNDTGKAIVEKLDDIANAISAGAPDNLSDLGDVDISSPTSNQALVYNPTTQKWENAMIPQTGTIEDVAIASFSDGADDVPVSELIVDIEARQEGSGTPSPDNVREIIGFTEVNVSRVGKNLFSYDLPLFNGYWLADGFHGNGAQTNYENARGWCFYPIKVVGGGQIAISGAQAATGTYACFYKDSPDNIISLFLNASMNGVKTVPQDANYLGFIINRGGTGLIDPKTDNPNAQIEIGSEASDYEAYNGSIYNIAFTDGDNPLTVYGGKLNVTTGELTITHNIIDLGSLDYTYSSGTQMFVNNSLVYKAPTNTDTMPNAICSQYVAKTWTEGTTDLSLDNIFCMLTSPLQFRIRDTRYSDPTAFKAAMSGVMLVYELATPIEIQLTPVQVKTLLNNNNIFADTGNIEKLVYFKTGCEAIATLIEAAPNLASVQSVNCRTGAVELDAFNIPYDSENSIAEKVTGIEEDIDANAQAIEANKVKSIFITTTYACSYADNNTIGFRGTGPNITTLTGYPTGKNILAVVLERSYVGSNIYPAITSLDNNILYTESKNSGTAYVGMRVLYTD